MSNDNRGHDSSDRVRPVSEEAAYWYLLCVKEPSSTADRRKFLAWLLRSPEHISELFKTFQLDRRLRRLKRTVGF
jgi:ferric-dicitrate binding protein FerR (iron transport regulator)